MSVRKKTYIEEFHIEIGKNDDRTITYTNDDSSVDLTNYTQKFIVAETDEEIFSNPKETITEATMTVVNNKSSFVLPDSLNIGYWRGRWIFTDSNGKDQTPTKGTIEIV